MRILAVTNMYPSPENPTFGTFIEQQVQGLRRSGVEVDVLFLDRAKRGVAAYLELPSKVRSELVRSRPDLVHVMYGGIMADAVTFTVSDRPTVVSFCGSDILGEPLSRPVQRLMARVGVLASRRAAKRADRVIVKARNLLGALPRSVEASKVRIVPNGVDFTRFKPLDRDSCRKRLGWREDGFHVLFPANTQSPTKRYGLARAAVDSMPASNRPAELHCLRDVSHDEVPVWLNASDALLLTSLHEGSPNIVKEALACDVAVVSVDVGDVRERIRGIEGCHIASSDPADLASLLARVRQGPGRVPGRQAMSDLSLERVSARLESLYGELVGESRDGGSTRTIG